ncbi:hypothetical protein B0H14DRAFT_3135077 [Mycena olivaceomarginata]|nr:hypothetical protein B0H14DRAFT_3135077 [Mycena olivaceomarginata]
MSKGGTGGKNFALRSSIKGPQLRLHGLPCIHSISGSVPSLNPLRAVVASLPSIPDHNPSYSASWSLRSHNHSHPKPTPGYPTLAPHEMRATQSIADNPLPEDTINGGGALAKLRVPRAKMEWRNENVKIVPVRGNMHWWLGAGETVAHKQESRWGNGEMEEGGARGIPQVGRAGHKRQSRRSGVGRPHRHRVGWLGQPTVVMDEMWGRAPQRRETRRAGWTAQRRGHGARAMGQAESGARPLGRCFISENGRSPRTTPRSDGRACGTISASERGCHVVDSVDGPPGGAIVAEASLGRVGHSPLGQQGRRAVQGGRAIGDLGEPTRAQIGRAKLAGGGGVDVLRGRWYRSRREPKCPSHVVDGVARRKRWRRRPVAGVESGRQRVRDQALGLWRGACAPRRTPRALSRRGRNESVRAMRLCRGELRIVVLDERLAQSLAAMSLAPGAQAAGRGRQFHRSGETGVSGIASESGLSAGVSVRMLGSQVGGEGRGQRARSRGTPSRRPEDSSPHNRLLGACKRSLVATSRRGYER